MGADALIPAAGGTLAAPRPRALAPHGLRPVTALRVAVAAMVLGNLGRVPVFSTAVKDAPLLMNDVALVVVLVLGAAACLRAQSLRLDRVALAALAFAAVGVFSAVLGARRFALTGTQLVFSLAYLARWLAYFGVYVVVVNGASRDDVPALWRTYERMALAFAGFGIVQSLFLPGFAQLVFPEETTTVRWDHQGHRMVSTLLDPNFAGAFVLLPLLVLLARLTYGERVPRWKLVVLFGALLMTVSRSTVLALVAGGIVLVAVRGLNRRLAAIGGGAALAILPFVPVLVRVAASFNKLTVDDSALKRVVSWVQALTVWGDNLWLGVGFNTYGFVLPRYGFEATAMNSSFSVDGGLLFIAVMTGIVGLLFYGRMLVVIGRRCRAVWRDAARDGFERGTALGVAAGTVAIVVHSAFVNSLLLPFIMEAQWLLWGLVFVIAASRPRAEAAS